MKAAVLHGAGDVRVEEVPERALAPGEVRLRTEAALTCGTDLKVFKRGYHAKMIVPPAVFGHELAGVIAESQSCDWQVGERVVVANSAPCGECFFCRNAQENLCDDLLFLNGAYAESIVVPARLAAKNMLRLQPATPFRDAALTEPLACVVQGIEDLKLRAGQRVLVLGSGPIGLMFVALARELGCEVAVAGRGENRLSKAKHLGAADVIDVGQSELATTVQNAMPRPSSDVVIEAIGKPESWEAAVQLVRKGGLVNFFGGCSSGTVARLDTTRVHYSSISTVASFHHTPRTIRRALEFIERGIIRAGDFVDGECELADLPALFQRMAQGNRAVKTAIKLR